LTYTSLKVISHQYFGKILLKQCFQVFRASSSSWSLPDYQNTKIFDWRANCWCSFCGRKL